MQCLFDMKTYTTKAECVKEVNASHLGLLLSWLRQWDMKSHWLASNPRLTKDQYCDLGISPYLTKPEFSDLHNKYNTTNYSLRFTCQLGRDA